MKYLSFSLLAILLFAAACQKEHTCACYSQATLQQNPPLEVNTIVKGRNRDVATRKCAELATAQGPTVTCYLK